MALVPDTGAGASITFGTSAFTGKYREIGELSQELEVVDTTDLSIASADEATNMPGDNPTPGEVRCRIKFDPKVQPPTLGVPETITITPPKSDSASSAPANVAGTGWVKSRRLLPNLQRNQLNEGEFVIQFNGLTGPTLTAEA